MKKMEEEMKTLSEYEKAMIVFDNFLGTSNRQSIHQVLIGGRYDSFGYKLSTTISN